MKNIALSALAMAIAGVTHAADVTVVGTVPTVVANSSAPAHASKSLRNETPNIVLLQKVKLSKRAHQAMLNRLAHPKTKATFAAKQGYPSQLELGMENVPVLNQGMHGSCVTFANSGAVNALLKKGDYVSELCSLTLGNYLEANDESKEYPSGWEGSWGPIVLKQLFDYGVVSMHNQQSYGCGGLYDYPVWDPSQTGDEMSPEEYGKLSENISDEFKWEPVLNMDDAFNSQLDADQVVNDVKDQLVRGNRVTFGVLLDVRYGSNGALGKYKARYGKDTWMLTDAIKKDFEDQSIEAGHEMIITGYDDDAVVTAPDGTKNKGLFILRNSWGTSAGNKGDYYMTYDHFKLLTLEAQALKAKA